MKNIFLAEDDADDRMFFEDALKEVAIPTKITLSKNGLELMSNLETLTAHPPPDVIFLDLNMPFKNGFECLQEIRETQKLKKIPIVILSTTKNDDVIDKTYKHGANYYIHKPHSFQLLVKAIETVLTLDLWNQNQQLTKENFVLHIS